MRLFRFMSLAEFQSFLKGEQIKGKFVKGKACFLEESIPAREKEASVKSLTDLTSLHFQSTDFEGQMKELSELISPVFENGDFEGQLKGMEHLTLSDFMKKVRENATAEVLVEFEPTEDFEYEKLIMAYQKYLIEEIQAEGYSNETLHCVSYQIDLINRFKDGIGVDGHNRTKFIGVEQALGEIDEAKWMNSFQSCDQEVEKMQDGAKKKQEVVQLIQNLKRERKQEQNKQLQENENQVQGR